jgi:hypothetical protein
MILKSFFSPSFALYAHFRVFLYFFIYIKSFYFSLWSIDLNHFYFSINLLYFDFSLLLICKMIILYSLQQLQGIELHFVVMLDFVHLIRNFSSTTFSIYLFFIRQFGIKRMMQFTFYVNDLRVRKNLIP